MEAYAAATQLKTEVISPEALVEAVKSYDPDADETLLRLAFDVAENAHAGQLRKSGEPYIVHPLATAGILAEWRLPLPIIIAGLLHDVPEDTAVTLADIRRDFGVDVASIVEGITKLGKLKYRGMERYVENLRKMFMAMASDVRVVLVKCADRIHNLETLNSLAPAKRTRIALESLELFAPIANRLGMNEIKSRLEDLAFRHVMPEEHAWVSNLAEQAIAAKRAYLEKAKEFAHGELAAAGIEIVSLHGRVKHLYSLYKKLLQHDRDIGLIYDVVALRVIVPTIGDCYAALGVLHQRWKPLKGRIKDYIAVPKPNGYRSLHTTVFCEGGEIVEFQIRTPEMHQEADLGVAAHWRYDVHGKVSTPVPVKQLEWVKELAAPQGAIKSPGDYLAALEAYKIDAFQNRIFVFTPKGDVIDLPEGATPVDFAYAIHSDVGQSCVGARVNERMVPLDATLASGDVCEIVRDKNRKKPNRDWLEFTKTRHAREYIRAQLREVR